MKKICVCTLSLALFAALSLAAEPAPSGSYQKTCKHISFSNNNLTATCSFGGVSGKPSTLRDAAGCVGDIGNVHGTLACTGAVGSFYLTCKDSRVEGSTLSSTCKKKDGSWVPASLEHFQGFDGNINNCDGQLRNGPC